MVLPAPRLLMSKLKEELKAASVSAVCITQQEMDRAEQEIAELKKDLEGERASLRAALFSLEHGNSLAGAQNKSATDPPPGSPKSAPTIEEGAEAENPVSDTGPTTDL
ncbi:hypothetical protein BSKO_02746 [Bryopsis sp. KO-2023]|nr:hypothetical protein BSKO_02746 [Bryopsis sp. KO-2023]